MEDKQDLFNFQIDHQGREEFTELSRWGRLQGIVVLCMLGIGFFTFIFAWKKIGVAISLSTPGEADRLVGFMAIIFIIAGLIVGVTMYFLIRGSNRIRLAVRTQDRTLLSRGLGDLRSYFAILGVLSIIALLSNLISLV